MANLIYKICPRILWHAAEAAGVFEGTPLDVQDGYIHLSTAEQVQKTATKHFAGQHDLLLIAADAARLGHALRYEPSRAGELFPHLYGPLPLSAVRWAKPLPLDHRGQHRFPQLSA